MTGHNASPTPQPPQEEQYQPPPIHLPYVRHLDGLPVENLGSLFVQQAHGVMQHAEQDWPGDDDDGVAKQQRHEHAAREAHRLETVWNEIDAGPRDESADDMVRRLGVFIQDLRTPHKHLKPSHVGVRRLPPQMFSPGERAALANTAERWMRDLSHMERDDLEPIVGPFRTPPPPPRRAPSPPPSHRTHHTPPPSHPAQGRVRVVYPPSSPPSGGPAGHDTTYDPGNMLPHYENLEGVLSWDMLNYIEAEAQQFEDHAQTPGISDAMRAGLSREIEVYKFIGDRVHSAARTMGDSPDETMDALASLHHQLGRDDDYRGAYGPLGDPSFRARVIEVIERLGYGFAQMSFDQLHEAISQANAPRAGAAPRPGTGGRSTGPVSSSPEPDPDEPADPEHYANLEGLTAEDLDDFLVATVVELAQEAVRPGVSDDEQAALRDEVGLYTYVTTHIGSAISRGEDSPEQIMAALDRQRDWLMHDDNDFQGRLANREYRQRLMYTFTAVHSKLSDITADELRETVERVRALDPEQITELFSALGSQPPDLGLNPSDSDNLNP